METYWEKFCKRFHRELPHFGILHILEAFWYFCNPKVRPGHAYHMMGRTVSPMRIAIDEGRYVDEPMSGGGIFSLARRMEDGSFVWTAIVDGKIVEEGQPGYPEGGDLEFREMEKEIQVQNHELKEQNEK